MYFEEVAEGEVGSGPPAPLPPVEEEEDGSPTKKKVKRKKKEEPEEEEYHQSADPAAGLPQVHWWTQSVLWIQAVLDWVRLVDSDSDPGNPLITECPPPLFHVSFVGAYMLFVGAYMLFVGAYMLT